MPYGTPARKPVHSYPQALTPNLNSILSPNSWVGETVCPLWPLSLGWAMDERLVTALMDERLVTALPHTHLQEPKSLWYFVYPPVVRRYPGRQADYSTRLLRSLMTNRFSFCLCLRTIAIALALKSPLFSLTLPTMINRPANHSSLGKGGGVRISSLDHWLVPCGGR